MWIISIQEDGNQDGCICKEPGGRHMYLSNMNTNNKKLMKRHYLLVIAVIFLCAASHAQQLGVNTDSPEARIDAVSSNSGILIPRLTLTATTDVTTVPTATVSEIVYNTATAGSGATAVTPGFYYWNGSVWVRITVGAEAVDDDWYDQSTPGSPPANITDNIYTQGNVGIGTTSPATKLHVYDDAAYVQMTLESDFGGATFNIDRDENDNEALVAFKTDNNIDWVIGVDNVPTGNVDDFVIKTTNNGDAEFVIETTGDVGIGTSAPSSLLHISSGTSGDAELIIQADTDNNNENDNPFITLKQD
ncbi:MAG: hypothetical protein GY751_18445, partial [Bacteroidetes bacterium]|nr:hypothetical protein [Bacteroidota bacterium]